LAAHICEVHYRADGRKISKQTFCILDKIKEVDEIIGKNPSLQSHVREIHPEVSFALWNSGRPMQHRKSCTAGRAEREALIDTIWPGQRHNESS